MKKKMKLMLLAVTMALILTAASANAATTSSGATAPTVDGFDIANYGTVTGTDKWWADAAVSGRPKGQTFTTGSAKVLLNAITYQVTSTQKAEPTKTYVIRVGTISGTTFTEIYSETATQDFFWAGGEYMTWALDTPVLLSADTEYGIDVGMTGSTSAWQTGIPYINRTADVYAGGTRYMSGTTGLGIGDTTMNNVSGDMLFHLDLSIADPMDPSPADGAEVSAGDVVLSWTNMAPITPGGDVYVDVWFGTDPNDETGTNFTKVVTATDDPQGVNTTTVTVSAPTVGETYYWAVDSYINGSPTGDPNLGKLYSFVAADLPPASVDAGIDMMTWLGEPVTLAPTIDDDGASPLSYLWTADPNDGVVFDSNSIETPTVTLNPPHRVVRGIQAQNDDAEEYINSTASGASVQQGTMKSLTDSDLELGTETDSGSPGLDWQVIAVQYDTLGIPQGATITSAKITFEVQNSGMAWTSNDFTILAEAGDDASVFSTEPNNITDRARSAASVAWVPDALPAVNAKVETPDITTLIQEVVDRPGWSDDNRLTLMIYPDVYLASPTGGTTTVQEIEFEAGPGSDAPTLTVEYLSTDSQLPAVVTLTLAVNDETNPEDIVEGTMTIDVYDTACLMARNGEGKAAVNPGDIDSNCITNLEDLVLLLGTWLNDNALTGPVTK